MPSAPQSAEEAVQGAESGPSGADLEWLVCPVCRSSLRLVEAQQGASSKIVCAGCARSYPVIDGLPILLAERATPTSATKV